MSKGNGFFAEFKKFVLRGNVMDMAVGVIIVGCGVVAGFLINGIVKRHQAAKAQAEETGEKKEKKPSFLGKVFKKKPKLEVIETEEEEEEE